MTYYEQQCSREMKEAYYALYRGAAAIEPAIRVPLLPIRELSEVYTRLRLDHPELFYLNGFHVQAVQGADYGELIPQYLFSRDKILTHKKAIDARVERLTREFHGKDEADKLRFLHRFIIDQVHYDKLEKPYSHEVIGPLTQGVGVCEGIAKSVKLLADALKLECIVALSAAEAGKKYGHAWNVLKCGGKWYHFDATFDLSLSACGEERLDYYLLPDVLIYRDHTRPCYPIPECSDNTRFFYREAKLSFTKQEELMKRITQSVRKKKPRFIFHWRGGFLTRELALDLIGQIRAAAADGGKAVSVSINWPQSVFCLSFVEAVSASDDLKLEVADQRSSME